MLQKMKETAFLYILENWQTAEASTWIGIFSGMLS